MPRPSSRRLAGTMPTQADALWAEDYLPLLYDLAWAFERRQLKRAYYYMAAVCHELDRVIAHRDYQPEET